MECMLLHPGQVAAALLLTRAPSGGLGTRNRGRGAMPCERKAMQGQGRGLRHVSRRRRRRRPRLSSAPVAPHAVPSDRSGPGSGPVGARRPGGHPVGHCVCGRAKRSMRPACLRARPLACERCPCTCTALVSGLCRHARGPCREHRCRCHTFA
jgi:hypothetical protein